MFFSYFFDTLFAYFVYEIKAHCRHCNDASLKFSSQLTPQISIISIIYNFNSAERLRQGKYDCLIEMEIKGIIRGKGRDFVLSKFNQFNQI